MNLLGYFILVWSFQTTIEIPSTVNYILFQGFLELTTETDAEVGNAGTVPASYNSATQSYHHTIVWLGTFYQITLQKW